MSARIAARQIAPPRLGETCDGPAADTHRNERAVRIALRQIRQGAHEEPSTGLRSVVAEQTRRSRGIRDEQIEIPVAVHITRHESSTDAWMLSDYDRAVELLEACLAKDPELMRAHHFLGLIALRKLDFDRAEEQFTEALDYEPGFADAHFNLGKIHLRRGDAERAVISFRQAIDYRSDYKEAYYQLSFAYRRLGREELAAETLAHFEKLDVASR